MGIHNFHKWLKDNYHKCYIGTETPYFADHIYIDINFALHNCIYGVKSYDALMKKLTGFIDNVLDCIVPKKKLILATDGPAPYAKLLLQRERRLQMARKLGDDIINDKVVTALWFTPGTNFMMTIGDKLAEYINKIKKKFNIEVETMFNSVDEAEVKIMRKLLANNINDINESHVIISNDADVIVMAASTPKFNNIYVGIKMNKTTELFNIGQFVKQLNTTTNNTNNKSNIDFAMLSLMMGNDYLPKIMCANFEKLWECYKITLKRCKTSLVDKNNKIDPVFMAELMMQMAMTLNNGWINKFKLSTFDEKMYTKYLEGLTWCLDIYRTGICGKYDYMYEHTPPHPLGIHYYLKYVNGNIEIKYPLNPSHITSEGYALLLLPKKAKCLINKKYHKLIDNQLKFLYDEEDCKTCIDAHGELQKLGKSCAFMRTMGEDVDDITKKIGNMSVKLGKHKKIHKDITIKDINSVISIINKIK